MANLKGGKRKFFFSEVQKWTKKERNSVSPYISEMVRKACINRLGRGEYIPYVLRKKEGEKIILSKDKEVSNKITLSNYF